ncbi:MAG TPA: CoA transferase [Streptosporangiaceae bacterium]|jgi:formyl-CoA transferase|nr:CoA transferase [Streptosporangiaceae bacterium]
MTASATPVTGSLHGLRVIELGTSVAAPMAGQILGDLGAEVIKVERVGRGDDSRSWAPPHWGGESVTFLALNRNKKSVALDYKDPRGKQVLEDLIRDADVLVHNLRPGALAAAGFGEDELRRLNPRLINVELTGFGPDGPRAGQPGYDPLLQAYSGMVSITGQDDAPPSRVPVSLLDMGTGMWAVLAVYEGLRRRDATGLGCHVELSLLQTALTWLSMPLLSVLAGNPPPGRLGSGLAGVVPYGAYPTDDGYVFISAGNDAAWDRLCHALDAAPLREREGFATNTERVRARAAVDAELGLVTSAFDTTEVLRRLGAAGVPCAPVQTLDQVVTDEQVAAVGAISPLPHDRVAGFSVVNLPVTFDGARLAHRSAPPDLGADSVAVLAGLGRGPAEIDELVRCGVVQAAPTPVSERVETS